MCRNLLRGIAQKEAALDWNQVLDVLEYNPKTGFFYRLTRNNKGVIVIRTKIANSSKHEINQRIYINGIQFYAHRLAWRFYYGRWPATRVHHKNGDQSDNRIANLKIICYEDPRVLAIYNNK